MQNDITTYVGGKEYTLILGTGSMYAHSFYSDRSAFWEELLDEVRETLQRHLRRPDAGTPERKT